MPKVKYFYNIGSSISAKSQYRCLSFLVHFTKSVFLLSPPLIATSCSQVLTVSPSASSAAPQGVWDELEMWHSCLAALEVDIQDLEKPSETLVLMERLVEVQQLYSQLSKQAEQRTTLISKVGPVGAPWWPPSRLKSN